MLLVNSLGIEGQGTNEAGLEPFGLVQWTMNVTVTASAQSLVVVFGSSWSANTQRFAEVAKPMTGMGKASPAGKLTRKKPRQEAGSSK